MLAAFKADDELRQEVIYDEPLWAALFDVLNERQRVAVYELIFVGVDRKELVADLGVSRSWCFNMLQDIARRLRGTTVLRRLEAA